MTNRGALRSNSNISKTPSTSANASNRLNNNSNSRGDGGYNRNTRVHSSDYMRIGERHDVMRIPPRERDFMRYDAPGRFWAHSPHYYGYRVQYLPPRFRRMSYWGIDYYIYDGIYYRPWNGVYIVCRPPFGIRIRYSADLALSALSFAYYSNVYRTYRAIDANNRTIDEQNRIIAQNNATIASQNQTIALNSTRAANAYSVADRLGLVQSYASAQGNYFYQDGVFYSETSSGQYEVIVPPAGALVSELPDDYETITLDGVNYYKVDNTVFTLTLVAGVPYLEVLGQMYGNLAQQYDSYGANATANTLNLY